MAIAGSAIWRIRPNGSDQNGAGYDGVAYPGGTDYSQQDAPQATFAMNLTAAANSTTLSLMGATAAWVGNCIYITGGTNAIVGWYFITAVTNATTVVLDRVPATAGALTLGSGFMGGAAQNPRTIITGPVVARNMVYAYTPSGITGRVMTTLAAAATAGTLSLSVASAAGFPASGAYYALIDSEVVRITGGQGSTTWTVTRAQNNTSAAAHASGAQVIMVDYIHSAGSFNANSGSNTTGIITLIGQNGRPTMHHNSRWIDYGTSYFTWREFNNFFGSQVGNSNGWCGLAEGGTLARLYVNTRDPTGSNYVRVFNTGGQCAIESNEIESGSLTPSTTATGLTTISLGGGSRAMNNIIRGMPGVGIQAPGGSCLIYGNVIYKNGNDAIFVQSGGFSDQCGVCKQNTIDGTMAGDGINFQAYTWRWVINNNIISNNTGASKVGLRVAGTAAANDSLTEDWRRNAFYNNSAHTSGLTIKSSDVVGIDPAYTNAPAGDHSIGPALKALGAPTLSRFATTSYVDPGAAQRQEVAAVSASGGATVTIIA